MTDDRNFDDEVRGALGDLGDERDPAVDWTQVPDAVSASARGDRSRRQLLTAAAAFVAIGVGVTLVVLPSRDDDTVASPNSSPSSTSAPPATDETTATSDETVSTSTPAESTGPPSSASESSTTSSDASTPASDADPTDEIVWQRVTEPGSVARSWVVDVAAGPAGFVAIGMGFDDHVNQGRLWHSVDGTAWDEPAFDLFEDKTVSALAVTADAYYVVAGTNPDRLGLGEGAVSPDVGLYRSPDGETWERVSDEIWPGGALASTGDGLLRQPIDGVPEWSADGLSWSRATFEGGLLDSTSLDLIGGIELGPGEMYLRAVSADGFAVWRSADGRTWSRLPDPPEGGSITAVPGGLALASFPRGEECNEQMADAMGDRVSGSTPPSSVDVVDVAWSCTAAPNIYRYDLDAGAWTAAAGHPGATPTVPVLDRLVGTLLIAMVTPEKAMTVWTAPLDGSVWTEQPDTRLPYIENTGSPSAPLIAVGGGRAVVFSGDRLVDGETAILLGVVMPTDAPETTTPTIRTTVGSPTASSTCTHSSCRFVAVVATGLEPGASYQVDCFSSIAGQFDTGNSFLVADADGDINGQATCYFGHPGAEVWLTLGDHRAESVIWPGE